MKLIPLRETATQKAVDIIRTVMTTPGHPNGLDVTDVMARARVLKALTKSVSPAGLLLEDGDHKTLVDAVKAFRFGLASEDLADVLQDILDAKEPPAISSALAEMAEKAAAA